MQVCSPPLGEGGDRPPRAGPPEPLGQTGVWLGPGWGLLTDSDAPQPQALELYNLQDLGSVAGSDTQFCDLEQEFPAPYLNIPTYKMGLVTDPPNRFVVRIKSCVVTKHSSCTCHIVSSWQVFAGLRRKKIGLSSLLVKSTHPSVSRKLRVWDAMCLSEATQAKSEVGFKPRTQDHELGFWI